MVERVIDGRQIQTRVRQSHYEALQTDADRNHRSVAAQVAYIVEQWAETREGAGRYMVPGSAPRDTDK